ncbi:hypothetical protein FQA39_LY12535 [Lamprigera yunnana]|nr:hypothetical protein FQA39_LY12535 [Lamprigera yunnana]
MSTCIIFIKIVHNDYVYGNFTVTRDCINSSAEVVLSEKDLYETHADGIFVHYFIKELYHGPVYRQNIVEKYLKPNRNIATLQISLVPVCKHIIDYKWNYRMWYLVRERCELEHTLSYLSTLGGAFSALGDYFNRCAEIAGKISINQLKLAMHLNDPNIVSRCRLYLSLSLIQLHRFKLSRRIIYMEYVRAMNSTVIDVRLVNMCKGIWCKLKYDYALYKKNYKTINS